MSAILECQYLGQIDYLAALDLQHEFVEKRVRGEIPDRLLLLEHPPVVTQGRRECEEDFLSTPAEIEADGIRVVRIDRGGKLTYHGPGQLIGYFICEVTGMGGIKAFVRDIEEVIIASLRAYDIVAGRDVDHPGVWLGEEKIAAVGLHVSHNVTSHGFALNVDCDLSPYRHIVACGIKDRGITTMAMCTDTHPNVHSVAESIIAQSEGVFGRRAVLVA